MLLRRDLFLLHHQLHNAFDLSNKSVFLLVSLFASKDSWCNVYRIPISLNLNGISVCFQYI